MEELIGWECSCVFNLPAHEWPIAGYPAWVVVLGLDGNMMKLASVFESTENALWCNTSIIKTIKKSKKHEETF